MTNSFKRFEWLLKRVVIKLRKLVAKPFETFLKYYVLCMTVSYLFVMGK